MGARPGELIDHKDGNKLNNQKANLRFADKSKNSQNLKLPSTNTSGYKGVSQVRKTGRWRAYIKLDQKFKALGMYNTPDEAGLAYDAAARELFGEFARFNFPKVGERGLDGQLRLE